MDNDYSSTDNASYWQGYPGYPIIAVLMKQKKLPFCHNFINHFANINWRDLNNKYKRDYDKAIEEVLKNMQFDINIIIEETKKTYEILKNMEINIKKKI